MCIHVYIYICVFAYLTKYLICFAPAFWKRCLGRHAEEVCIKTTELEAYRKYEEPNTPPQAANVLILGCMNSFNISDTTHFLNKYFQTSFRTYPFGAAGLPLSLKICVNVLKEAPVILDASSALPSLSEAR